MKKNLLYVGVAIVALGVTSGCATNTQDLDAVRATAEQALNEARAAKTAADAAQAGSEEAKRVATNAQNTANRAAQAASEAQACCAANTDRIERMFQRTMSK
ncbi:MAG TPA: Lpp/OprI family alanine-zipper lipoprotein [Gammaproteobacteria bacterium]|nr:Lpp/OprI family alanine-zipper lipoprotein [Gammaproteobacteria bacterium]